LKVLRPIEGEPRRTILEMVVGYPARVSSALQLQHSWHWCSIYQKR